MRTIFTKTVKKREGRAFGKNEQEKQKIKGMQEWKKERKKRENNVRNEPTVNN